MFLRSFHCVAWSLDSFTLRNSLFSNKVEKNQPSDCRHIKGLPVAIHSPVTVFPASTGKLNHLGCRILEEEQSPPHCGLGPSSESQPDEAIGCGLLRVSACCYLPVCGVSDSFRNVLSLTTISQIGTLSRSPPPPIRTVSKAAFHGAWAGEPNVNLSEVPPSYTEDASFSNLSFPFK